MYTFYFEHFLLNPEFSVEWHIDSCVCIGFDCFDTLLEIDFSILYFFNSVIKPGCTCYENIQEYYFI